MAEIIEDGTQEMTHYKTFKIGQVYIVLDVDVHDKPDYMSIRIFPKGTNNQNKFPAQVIELPTK